MLTPSIGVCVDAVDRLRLRQARRFEHGRRDVDHVLELAADLALGLDPVGPVHDQRLRVPPKLEATCLVHMNGVLPATAQPAAMCGKVSGPPQSSMFFSMSGTVSRDAVEVGHLVEHAVHAAFGAGAVVADDVEEQRVVQLAEVFDRLHHAADLVVGVRGEAGEHFHLPREQLLLVGASACPSP